MIIYKIFNNVNGKIYIGKTRRELSKRVSAHTMTNRFPIQKALNEYGPESFTISVIDYADSEQVLNEKEKYWIRILNCKYPNGYNLTDGGNGISEPCSEEKKKKISEANKGKLHSEETRKKISEIQKGKHIPEETRKKMSAAHKGKVFSEEHRKHLSESLSGNKNPWYGKHQPPEMVRKRAERVMGYIGSMRGKLHPEETKRKISEALKGRPISEETRRKISEAKKRENLSAETRRRLSESQMGRRFSPETIRKMSEAKKGKHPSIETIRKRSGGLRKSWQRRKSQLSLQF